MAAGSLIAALNVVKSKGVDIPYFFGGDGGVLMVPQELTADVMSALYQHSINSLKNFGLPMYIGNISVDEIRKAGRWIQLARLKLNHGLTKAIVVGDGLAYAEQQIKLSTKDGQSNYERKSELNLTGLECRWDRIKPPLKENEIICCIIEAVQPGEQVEVYHNVMRMINGIFGDVQHRNPLSTERLKLSLDPGKIQNEMRVKYGRSKFLSSLSTLCMNFIGRFFFRYNLEFEGIKAQEYLSQIISNADTLTIDGRISTIISGERSKRLRLLEYLDKEEDNGKLIYGYHVSNESVMTCYIENRDARHIHFVDGADGGYTHAAGQLKTKFKARIRQRT